MSADVARLARALAEAGLRPESPFAKPELVAEALTHSSYAGEKNARHNERLEMLGDSVLGFLVAEMLFDLLPDSPEGVLTRVRASLVDEASLAEKARKLHVGEALALGRGEELTGGRDRSSLLADAFEAMVAALYRSEGLDAAREIVRRLFSGDAARHAERGPQPADFKTQLQERVQALAQVQPQYRIVATSGPDHARTFVAEVRLGEVVAGQGEGRTKKQAEQQAAKAALGNWESLAPEVSAVAAPASRE